MDSLNSMCCEVEGPCHVKSGGLKEDKCGGGIFVFILGILVHITATPPIKLSQLRGRSLVSVSALDISVPSGIFSNS